LSGSQPKAPGYAGGYLLEEFIAAEPHLWREDIAIPEETV
jgi:hypothetical protein